MQYELRYQVVEPKRNSYQNVPELTIRHLPGLLKLQAAGRMVINRETVEAKLGREWDFFDSADRAAGTNVVRSPLIRR